MEQEKKLRAEIPENLSGLRLDQALAQLFPDFSRSRLQNWIRNDRVRVDGKPLRAKDHVEGGESVVLDAQPETILNCEPQPIPLNIVHEDSSLIVIDKAPGLVVHPAAGNPDGTLQNALLYHFPDLASLPRAGIIHRIDKLTSGLLVVARSLNAHNCLVKQLQAREIRREYIAITYGRMTAGGTVDAPIGRHSVDRKRYTVSENGKLAITHYRVVERFSYHTLVKLRLETGRTHQIRVHMAHLRYPLLGDPVYGGRMKIHPGCPELLMLKIKSFRRQALHAARLGLIHPESQEYSEWEIPLPQDMAELLQELQVAESLHSTGTH